tara:strand:+ start:877 stop:1851 length:975 start_codon:yes stop_codon:yes gene_type:complete
VEKKYSSLIQTLKVKLEACKTESELLKIKSNFLGKNGLITKEFSTILDAEDKKYTGQQLNLLKNQADSLIAESLAKIQNLLVSDNAIDVSLPGRNISEGTRHPISITINQISNIMRGYGFRVEQGNEIETEFYNFEALNIPFNHPARDMHDTFYVDTKKLLRTHTSSVQIHSMIKSGAPLKIIAPGKVYRCDSDPTHSPMFHQLEGLYIDKDINFCHLKGILEKFIIDYFQKEIETRFRPSYFPFTEPSAELDIKFRGKWLEVLGCGMVHENVLKNVGINPKKYSGFAFGLGIERFAMLKFDIRDLRSFYENDLSFLKQFRGVS